MFLLIKRFLLFTVLLFLVVAMAYSWMVWVNNRNMPWPEEQDIHETYESAVGWLLNNRDIILKTDNPALWRMVQRSAVLTGDDRLQELFDTYYQRYEIPGGRNYWRLLFKTKGWMPVRYEQIKDHDDYQQYFIYAITCDAELGQEPAILAQNDPSYCDAFPLRSSCVTHQMMGIQFLQERECGNARELASTMSVLQQRARNQLVWDPRLLDQYIQRVLMLIETDDIEQVKPVWLHRVMNGMLDDGGWPHYRKILNLPGKRDLIFTRNFIGLGAEMSSFHASAQGLLILAHLERK
jgi:hypothetical protein